MGEGLWFRLEVGGSASEMEEGYLGRGEAALERSFRSFRGGGDTEGKLSRESSVQVMPAGRTADVGELLLQKYIAIHVRHGDFRQYCDGTPTETCFAPLSVIAEHVEKVKSQLRRRQGREVPHVLLTSDETDPAFWDAVDKRGWSYHDWSKEDLSPLGIITQHPEQANPHWSSEEERLGVDLGDDRPNEIPGKWWPVLLDAACQSLATGFVGTEMSTMSLLAIRRVEEWGGGVGVMVRFSFFQDSVTCF